MPIIFYVVGKAFFVTGRNIAIYEFVNCYISASYLTLISGKYFFKTERVLRTPSPVILRKMGKISEAI